MIKYFSFSLTVIAANPSARISNQEEECEDPKAVPLYWVAKWVDYSDKYGFGYALSDDSIGVVFNDLTKLLLLSDGRLVHIHQNNRPGKKTREFKYINFTDFLKIFSIEIKWKISTQFLAVFGNIITYFLYKKILE